MTLPHERTRALLKTRDFLWELRYGDAAKLHAQQLRDRAAALLRHYPSPMEVELAHKAAPSWFASPFSEADPS